MAKTTLSYDQLNGGIVSVKDYGALGDGVTDDAAAIQAAFTAAGANSVVMLGTGTFLVGSKITIDDAGVSFIGNGAGTSKIKANFSNDDLFLLQNATGFACSDIGFLGAATDSTNAKYCFMTDSSNVSERIKISRCEFTGNDATLGFNNIIKFEDGCDYGWFTDNYIERLHGNASGKGYVCLIAAVTRCHFSGNTAIGGSVRGRHAFYLSSGATYCEVTNNHMVDFDYAAITIAAGAAQSACSYNTVSLNTAVGGNALSSLEGHYSIFGNCHYNKFIGNTSVNSGLDAFLVNASISTDASIASDNKFIGNDAITPQRRGFAVVGALRTKLKDNTVSSASQESSGSYASYQIQADTDPSVNVAATDTTLIGNVAEGSSGRSSLTLNSTSPTPVNTRLYGNNFPSLASYSIEDNSIQYFVDDCLLFDFTNDYASIASDASFSQTFTATGVAQGDPVSALGFDQNQDGVDVTAECTATDQITITRYNHTAGALDLANANIKVEVIKRQ